MRGIYLLGVCVICFVSSLCAQEGTERVYFGPEKAEIGGDFPDTFLQDTLKQSHRISDYLDGEKYLLLDFWFLNCGSCIRSFPELRELHENHSDKLKVISINIDPHRYTFRMTTRVKEITWVSLWDNMEAEGLLSKYGVRGCPLFVLISPEGKIIDTNNGYAANAADTNFLRKTLLRNFF